MIRGGGYCTFPLHFAESWLTCSAGYEPSLAPAVVATVLYTLLCGVYWYRKLASSFHTVC